MGHDLSSLGIEYQGHSHKMYPTQVATVPSYEYWLMAIEVGFHCDVISCELALQGVWRGSADAGNEVQHVWSW